MRALVWFSAFFFLFGACTPDPPEEVPLPTSVCISTYHHHQPIPDARIFVKFNADSFPGYEQSPSYYDAVFFTGKDARGCLAPVPEGTHWLVGFGYDSLYFPHYVKGSLRVSIDLNGRATVDTVMQISEEH